MNIPAAGKVAFIGHPTDLSIYKSYINVLKPEKTYREEFLVKLFEWTPPYKVKDFPRLSFDSAHSVDGMLIMVPFLPEMRDIKVKRVLGKIEEALALASSEGCTVAAMGGFTSIVLQGIEADLSKKYSIKITSGNSLTAAIIIRSIETIARKFGVDLVTSSVALIGASGDIGSACMGYLGPRVKKIYCTARSIPTLSDVVKRHSGIMQCETVLTDNNREAVSNSSICIFVTSAFTALFSQDDFRPGTIVCDASAPVNVRVNDTLRHDVFIYHGGVASIPFELGAGFDVGLASSFTFYGCQLEGLLLALNPTLPCSWGRGNISPEKLECFFKELYAHRNLRVVFSIGKHMYSNESINEYADRWKSMGWGLTSLKDEGEAVHGPGYQGQTI